MCAALVAAALLSAPVTAAPSPSPDGPARARAVWMWEEATYRLLDGDRPVEDVASFLERRGISTVYLYADRYRGRNVLAQRPARYRRLLRHLHDEGLEVYALLGSIHLHTERYVLPEYRAEARAMLRRVFAYNDSVSSSERFDGVNVDVEPHLLDAWDDDRARIARLYLDLSRTYMEMKREHDFAGPVGPSVPFWLDGMQLTWNGETRTVSEHVQRIYDYVTIMAYRDRATGSDGILEHVSDEIACADSLGKRVVVGVETGPDDLDKVTFRQETPERMEDALAEIVRALGGRPSFGGVAIHHYESYREWLAAGGR